MSTLSSSLSPSVSGDQSSSESSQKPTYCPQVIDRLIGQVDALRNDAAALESEYAGELQAIPSTHRASARNLLHYLSLRRRDLRRLQRELMALGLSSLGRAEGHVMASLNALAKALRRLNGHADAGPHFEEPADFCSGPSMLIEHTDALLGGRNDGRAVRLMVTMPSQAADDPTLIRDYLAAGMDCMRVNCAHDGPVQWLKMIETLRHAETHVDRRCRVMCDLGGPKLRTGDIERGPCVLHFAPSYDKAGSLQRRARVWIGDTAQYAGEADIAIPAEGPAIEQAQPGDFIRFTDVRGRDRSLHVIETMPGGVLTDIDRGAYVGARTPITLWREGRAIVEGAVGHIPALEQVIELRPGDMLSVTPATQIGRPAKRDAVGKIVEPATIGCTLPEVFRDVRPGHRIFFDDGKISAVVLTVESERIGVQITHTLRNPARLGADKGINLPDTDLQLPAMTQADLADLDFIARYSDMVGLSFVRSAADVEQLVAELECRGASDLGIVLKIETRRAFEQLPRLLLSALRSPPAGIMLARGDLAVEVGFERLAEMQEEILWLCEASHVPVIWATQVLESMAKDGLPSRAEVTDAAMSGRAECVMLNKGPHIVEVLRFLSGILRRMQDHQDKKTSMLRRLEVSRM